MAYGGGVHCLCLYLFNVLLKVNLLKQYVPYQQLGLPL